MSHTLSFSRPYKSITALNVIDLPSITILTGTNGSGKSHLLQAIETGSVLTTASSEGRKYIRLFDWNSIVPKDAGIYNPGARAAKVEDIIKRIKSTRDQVVTQLQNQIEQSDLDRNLILSIEDLEIACDLSQRHTYQTESARNTANHVMSWVSGYRQYFLNTVASEEQSFKQAIRDSWQVDFRTLMFADSTRLRSLLMVATEPQSQSNIFSQAFAEIFVDYMKKLQENELSKNNGESYLTEQDFINEHHIPPWDFVNDILRTSNLKFKITSPRRTKINDPFEPKLIKDNTGKEMSFQDLSSGERVLMSFALCVYNSFAVQNSVIFPKLLLLDEVDAPLHPEMVGVMLNVIKEILVEKHSIQVVLTTHKPTTVALAPEGSIFQMLPEGPEVRAIDRERAVSLLTVGVPTMAFTTDLRLQVFTEGRIDAYFYGKMYQLFKSKMTSNRSLEFIPSGRRSLQGDKDSGKPRVKKLVADLRKSGASTILGIVDWDKSNKQAPWVYVLCRGKRYSLENLAADPVTLVSLLGKYHFGYARHIDVFRREESYVDILKWDQNRWQVAVDQLSSIVFPDGSKKVRSSYANGMVLDIYASFLQTRGHDLISNLADRLPVLEDYGCDGLIKCIADSVLPDIKDLAPQDILDCLEGLTSLGSSSLEVH